MLVCAVSSSTARSGVTIAASMQSTRKPRTNKSWSRARLPLEHHQDASAGVHGDRHGHPEGRRRERPLRPGERRQPEPTRREALQRRPARPRRGVAATPRSVRSTWLAIPAATPASGPPSSAVRTIAGVEAVYQLRGPSWNDDPLRGGARTSSAANVAGWKRDRPSVVSRPAARRAAPRAAGTRLRLRYRARDRRRPAQAKAHAGAPGAPARLR